MYACMCCISLIICLYLYVCAYLCLWSWVDLHTVAALHLRGFEHQRKCWCFIVTTTTQRYNEAKESMELHFQTCCNKCTFLASETLDRGFSILRPTSGHHVSMFWFMGNLVRPLVIICQHHCFCGPLNKAINWIKWTFFNLGSSTSNL